MDFINDSGLEAAWVVNKINPPAFSLTAIVKGTFRLHSGEEPVLAEEQLPLTGDQFESEDPSKPLRYASDFAPFKPRADVMLVGTCHSPNGSLATDVRARLQVGPLEKILTIYGDCYRTKDGFHSDPIPFITMPLSWERAFGGPDFERNPLGKGIALVTRQDGLTMYPLPNIESPGHPSRSQTGSNEPAGFGPVPDMWPQRLRKFGAINEQYLKKRWPGLPEGTDWGYFNAAPKDQQITGYLRGDEELAAENLHSTAAQYRSRLPGLRARCFLNERIRGRQVLREISMNLDTLWIDMDSETLVLVWRGNAEVRTQKLIGCEHFFILTEPLTQPPSDNEHVMWLLDEALARQEEEEEELEPEEEPEAEAELESDTGEPEEEPVQESPVAAEAAGGSDETDAEDPAESEPGPSEEIPLTEDRVRLMIAQQESFAGCDLSGLDLAGLDFSRLDMREAILEGAVLIRANLSQANLAGAVLTGANLREAQCISTSFSGADLTEAWLTAADLSHADLSGADLTKSRLRLAIMRGVNAADSIFVEADLSDARMEEADLTAADFCYTRLHRADFTRAILTDAAFENAWGRYVKAPEAVMHKVRGAEALLCEADFHLSLANESVWEYAQLFRANYTGATLTGAEFSGAYLDQAVFDAAELKEARFNEATLCSAHMHRCNLLGASLDQADLTAAILIESNLFGASLMDSLLDRTNLAGANLRRIKSKEEII